MKRCIGAMTALILFSASTAFADVGPRPIPGPQLLMGARDAKLVVKKDDNAKVARLVVPVGLLVPQPGFRRGAVDGLPAVVAGLALTAAFVSCGFWLVRKNRGVATLALIASLAVFGTSAVQADIAIEPKPVPAKPVTLPANVTIDGKLILEVVPNGDTIELILPTKKIVETKPDPK